MIFFVAPAAALRKEFDPHVPNPVMFDGVSLVHALRDFLDGELFVVSARKYLIVNTRAGAFECRLADGGADLLGGLARRSHCARCNAIA